MSQASRTLTANILSLIEIVRVEMNALYLSRWASEAKPPRPAIWRREGVHGPHEPLSGTAHERRSMFSHTPPTAHTTRLSWPLTCLARRHSRSSSPGAAASTNLSSRRRPKSRVARHDDPARTAFTADPVDATGGNLLGLRGASPPACSRRALTPSAQNIRVPDKEGVTGWGAVSLLRTHALKYGHVSSIKAYMDTNFEQSAIRSKTRSELQTSGVSIIDTPHNGGKEGASCSIRTWWEAGGWQRCSRAAWQSSWRPDHMGCEARAQALTASNSPQSPTR